MTVLRFSCLQAGLPEKYHKLILHHIIRHCYKKCRASCPSRIIPAVRQSSFGWQYRCVTIFGTLALFVLEAAGKLGGKAVFVFVGVGGHGGGWRLRPSEKTKGGIMPYRDRAFRPSESGLEGVRDFPQFRRLMGRKGRLKYFSDGLCLNSVYCQTESA